MTGVRLVGMNEVVILEFCRFSYAINAPLCVSVKLLERWCLGACVLDVCACVHGPPNTEI